MRCRGVCRLSVCLSVRVSVNFFAGIATTTPKMARSLPNLHRMVNTWARIQIVLKVEVKVKGHVIRAFLCRSRKSLLDAGEWPDCDQPCTRWSPCAPASRVCSSRMVTTWACIQTVLKVEVKVKGQVIRAFLCRSRKSLLVAGEWPDCDQTCTRWSPGAPASRVCSRSRSRSKVTC